VFIDITRYKRFWEGWDHEHKHSFYTLKFCVICGKGGTSLDEVC
jgi:hypothetical protein